jgi:hypothetical protein
MRSICLIALLLVALPAEVHPITFADGGFHIIDATNSFPFEDVTILDSPGGAPTTVEIVAGGELSTFIDGTVAVFGSSSLQLSGGTVANLEAKENSEIRISSGEVAGTFQAFGDVQTTISGGTTGNIEFNERAVLEVSDGVFGNITARGTAWIDFSGGHAAFITALDFAEIRMSGGDGDGGLIAAHDSTMTISDALSRGGIQPRDRSTVTITGGTFSGGIFRPRGSNLTESSLTEPPKARLSALSARQRQAGRSEPENPA